MFELAIAATLLAGPALPAIADPDRLALYTDRARVAVGRGVDDELRRWGVRLERSGARPALLEGGISLAPNGASSVSSALRTAARTERDSVAADHERHLRHTRGGPVVPELDLRPMALRQQAEYWSDGVDSFIDFPKELILSLSKTRESSFSLRVRSVTRFTVSDPNQVDAPQNAAVSQIAAGVGWSGGFGELRLYACYTDSLDMPLLDRDFFYRDESDRRINAILEWRVEVDRSIFNVHVEMFEGMDVSEWGANFGVLIERP